MGERVSSASQRQQETVKKSVMAGIPGLPVALETLFSARPTPTQSGAGWRPGGRTPGWEEGPVASAFCQQA